MCLHVYKCVRLSLCKSWIRFRSKDRQYGGQDPCQRWHNRVNTPSGHTGVQAGLHKCCTCLCLNKHCECLRTDLCPTIVRSGAKRIFAIAEVNTPPGAYDLYSEQETLHCLAVRLSVVGSRGEHSMCRLSTRHCIAWQGVQWPLAYAFVKWVPASLLSSSKSDQSTAINPFFGATRTRTSLTVRKVSRAEEEERHKGCLGTHSAYSLHFGLYGC